MAQKAITGLQKMPSGIWKIDKNYRGERIQESTGTCDRKEAEQYLIQLLEKLRQEKVYGVKKVSTWREAANRLTRTSADDPEEEAGITGKPKVTRTVTRVEMQKPPKRWLSH